MRNPRNINGLVRRFLDGDISGRKSHCLIHRDGIYSIEQGGYSLVGLRVTPTLYLIKAYNLYNHGERAIKTALISNIENDYPDEDGRFSITNTIWYNEIDMPHINHIGDIPQMSESDIIGIIKANKENAVFTESTIELETNRYSKRVNSLQNILTCVRRKEADELINVLKFAKENIEHIKRHHSTRDFIDLIDSSKEAQKRLDYIGVRMSIMGAMVAPTEIK